MIAAAAAAAPASSGPQKKNTRQSRAARYRLDVLLDDQLEGLGLLTDDTVGRERRTLRARYQLVDISNG